MPKKIFKLALVSFLILIGLGVNSSNVFAASNDPDNQQVDYSETPSTTQDDSTQPVIVIPEITSENLTQTTPNNSQTAVDTLNQIFVEPEQSTSPIHQIDRTPEAQQLSMISSNSSEQLETKQEKLTITIDDIYTTSHSPIISGFVSDNDAIVTIEIYGKEYQATVKNNRFTLENIQIIPYGIHGSFTIKITAKKDEQRSSKTIMLHLSPSPKKLDSHTHSKSRGSTVYGYSSLENSDGKMSKSSDLDADGYSDQAEKLAGTNPNNANSKPDDTGETSSQKTEKPIDSTEENKRNYNIQWILIGVAATAFLAFILRDQSNDR